MDTIQMERSYLIVKEPYVEMATDIFEGTNIIITTRGKRHLGAALGSQEFIE